MPGTGVEDFVPWVVLISSLPLASEGEEDEDGMADFIHNFGSFERTTDVTPEVMGEAEQHLSDGGSKEQAIVVMDSPKIGFHGQPDVETTHSVDLEEAPLTHEEARGGGGGGGGGECSLGANCQLASQGHVVLGRVQ